MCDSAQVFFDSCTYGRLRYSDGIDDGKGCKVEDCAALAPGGVFIRKSGGGRAWLGRYPWE